jgi:hypothetical protein
MTKSSAITRLRNRYAPNVNGVQVIAGSNPATPIFEANPCQKCTKLLDIVVFFSDFPIFSPASTALTEQRYFAHFVSNQIPSERLPKA